MKRAIYIITAIAMIAVGVTSCYNPNNKVNPKDPNKGIEGTILVDIDGSDEDHGYIMRGNHTNPTYVPADKTTYTVVSYRTNYWNPATQAGGSLGDAYWNYDRGSYYYILPGDSEPLIPYNQNDRLTDEYNVPYAYHLDPPGAPRREMAPWRDRDYSNGYGRYVYLADYSLYRGILQPCDVDETEVISDYYNDPAPTYSFVERNAWKGQGLLNRDYKTVFIQPAYPIVDIPEPNAHTRGLKRILFRRNDRVLASEPFSMTVAGYGIFNLPDTAQSLGIQERRLDMHDVRAKILIDVVRDVDMNSDFTVTNVRLKDAGYWGWYHPLMQYTDISYYDDDVAKGKTSDPGYPRSKMWVYVGQHWAMHPYVSTAQFNDHANDTSVEKLVEGSPALWASHDGDTQWEADLYETGNRAANTVYYTTGVKTYDGIYLFANDYLSGNYLTPSLLLELNMGDVRNPNPNPDDISTFRMNIPMTMKFKPGYQYRFKMVVSSTAIRVTFQIKPWWEVSWGDDNLGIAPPDRNFNDWIVLPWDDMDDSGLGGGLMKRK